MPRSRDMAIFVLTTTTTTTTTMIRLITLPLTHARGVKREKIRGGGVRVLGGLLGSRLRKSGKRRFKGNV